MFTDNQAEPIIVALQHRHLVVYVFSNFLATQELKNLMNTFKAELIISPSNEKLEKEITTFETRSKNIKIFFSNPESKDDEEQDSESKITAYKIMDHLQSINFAKFITDQLSYTMQVKESWNNNGIIETRKVMKTFLLPKDRIIMELVV